MAKPTAGVESQASGLRRRGDVDLYRLSAEVRAFGRRFSWQASLDLLQVLEDAMVESDSVVCSLELAALGWARQWGRCLHLLNELPKTLVDTPCCNAAASACSTASVWITAFQVVEDLAWRALLPTTVSVNSLFASFKDGNSWMPALGLLSYLSEHRCAADTETIAGAIESCREGRNWHWGVSQQLLEEAAARLLETGRRHLEGVMYAESASWARTMSLLSQAKQCSCAGDSSLYRQGISSCLSCRCVGQALQVLRSCKADDVQPTTAMYGAILAACSAESKWPGALSVLEGELVHGTFMTGAVDGSMCCSAITACRAQTQWAWAIRIFRHARPCPGLLPIGASISSLGHAARWAQGLDILRTVDSCRMPSDASNWDACLGLGDQERSWPRALTLLASAQSRHLEASTWSYSSLVSLAERGEVWIRAAGFLEGMQQKGVRPHVAGCSAVIASVQEFRHWEWAAQVWAWMNQHQLEPNSYCSNALASVCEKAKVWRQSLRILFSASSRGFSLDAFSLTAGVAACEKAGRWEQCLRLLEAGSTETKGGSSASSAMSFTAAAAAAARADAWAEAFCLGAALWEVRALQAPAAESVLHALSQSDGTPATAQLREWLQAVRDEASSQLEMQSWQGREGASSPPAVAPRSPRVAFRAVLGAAELLWEEQAVTAQFDACLQQQVLPSARRALEELSLRPASRSSIHALSRSPMLAPWMFAACTDCCGGLSSAWLPLARGPVRRPCGILTDLFAVSAGRVACWTAASLSSEGATAQLVRVLGFRRRIPTTAGCDHGRDLHPIFAEGDRAPHAERQALLDVLVLADGLLCKKAQDLQDSLDKVNRMASRRMPRDLPLLDSSP
ncbi:MRL1 [Symbiodinium sp. CCMP2456]|nr:MRL1 [Symbiodinium sp. CCMP2456]